MKIIRKLLGPIIRSVLPPRWIRIIRHPILLPHYYRAFANEIEPALDKVHTNHNSETDYFLAMLRKYVHILDKSLHRPDFEPGHSKQWYEASTNALSELNKRNVIDQTVIWAKEKIAEYERRQINNIKPQAVETSNYFKEDLNTLMRIIQGRRSIRNFTNQPIETDKLKIIIEAVNWSPTSCNRQPAKVFVAKDRELIQQCSSTCAGATCFNGDAACFIAFCADMRGYNMPEEFLLPDLDIGLGIQNCLLVAHTIGISVTLLTWAQHSIDDDKKLRSLLNIPSYYRIIVNALMGYPTDMPTTPARKSIYDTLNLVS